MTSFQAASARRLIVLRASAPRAPGFLDGRSLGPGAGRRVATRASIVILTPSTAPHLAFLSSPAAHGPIHYSVEVASAIVARPPLPHDCRGGEIKRKRLVSRRQSIWQSGGAYFPLEPAGKRELDAISAHSAAGTFFLRKPDHDSFTLTVMVFANSFPYDS